MKAIFLGSLAVLADTVFLRRQAFRNAFREHGLDFSGGRRAGLERFTRARRPTWDDRAVPIGSVLDARNHYFGTALAKGPLTPRAGLYDLIEAAGRAGIALGLVVSTPSAWTQAVFEGLDLAPEVFDTIVATEQVVAGKPAADCYHYAAAMLATAPEDCLAIEDTPAGLASARAAGLPILDLTGPDRDMVNPLPQLARTLRGRHDISTG
ncbi:HAD family hydrolase [Jannaschia sp. 2305UL9-9]|uniref:HAD family hydrolase n=1 Tax=Jannaschia sp. 2305UL9-9 TaxID=3121638 RepID=UPI0035281275